MRILVVNAGSSTLKLRLLDGEDIAAKADLPVAPADLVNGPGAERLGSAGELGPCAPRRRVYADNAEAERA